MIRGYWERGKTRTMFGRKVGKGELNDESLDDSTSFLRSSGGIAS